MKRIFTSIALIFLFVMCIDDAFSQSETSKALPIALEHYSAHAFPLEGWGNAVVDPQVPSLYGSPHLFGDWFGSRQWLTRHGLHLNFAVNEEYMGNVRGGRTRSSVLAGQVAGELDIDWQRLAGVSGLWTHLLVINGHGRNFGYNLGDSVTNPEQIYGGRGNVVAHLVAMYAEKTFLRKRIVVSAGDIPTGSFFAYDYVACSFMNVSVCSNFAPGKYVPGGRDWPSGNLGGVVRAFPAKKVYVMGGIFVVSPHAYNGGISGWALAQSGMSKVSSQVEVGWMPWFGKHALRGNYKIGAWYDNSRYPNLYADIHGNSFQLTGQPRRYEAGMTTAWFMFDQMLVRNGPGVAEGLLAVGGAGYSQGNLVAMRDHEWIGLVETGSPWHRRQDQIGAMFQHMDMSSTVSRQQESSRALGLPYLANQWGPVWGVQHWENVYEAFYSTHVLRDSTTMQFDFQYLQHPGASTTFRDAAVLGIQLTANL